MSFEVSTAVFDGPFDLLLHLIVRDEVELYEISLSDIVEAYLSEIERMEMFNLEIATEFLLIAATLVELKSRRLLPDQSDLDLDDELALWEERDLLLARLLECKTFKDAATALNTMALDAARSYPRTAGLEDDFIGLMPDLLEGVDARDIRDAFVKATAPKPIPQVNIDHLAPITVSVSDAVEEITLEVRDRSPVSFRALTASLVDRIEVVVYFLAALELYKQDLVDITQFTTFGDITLVWIGGERADAELIAIDDYDG